MDINLSTEELYLLISDIDPLNSGIIAYADLKTRVLERELNRLMGSDESELLDAYVAMGGEPDGGGCVDAKKLIETIKNDF